MNPPEQQKILIVDDTPQFIKMLLDALKPMDHDIFIAANGPTALEIAETENLDLILLDIIMPDMDGFEVCRKLKGSRRTRDVPIIFITGKGGAEDETDGLELGAVDYIVKPFNPSVVRARVKTHLALQQAKKTMSILNARLLSDREVIETILSKTRHGERFDDTHLRYLISPLEKTTGDLLLAARHADGGQCAMLGDFTGHGLTAAVGGPLVADIFYGKIAKGEPMVDIIMEINRKLFQVLPEEMFLASAYIQVDADRQRATVWNCGLNDVLVYRRNSLYKTVESGHFPNGLVEMFLEAGTGIDLSPGDRIYAYTDGIIEDIGADNTPFGEERLHAFLSRPQVRDEPLTMLEKTLERLRGTRMRKDDMTLLEITC